MDEVYIHLYVWSIGSEWFKITPVTPGWAFLDCRSDNNCDRYSIVDDSIADGEIYSSNNQTTSASRRIVIGRRILPSRMFSHVGRKLAAQSSVDRLCRSTPAAADEQRNVSY